MSTPESRTYLAHLLADLLAVPDLPADLRIAVTDHLTKQLNLVSLLKPEYCRRLYPVIVELAEMAAPARQAIVPPPPPLMAPPIVEQPGAEVEVFANGPAIRYENGVHQGERF